MAQGTVADGSGGENPQLGGALNCACQHAHRSEISFLPALGNTDQLLQRSLIDEVRFQCIAKGRNADVLLIQDLACEAQAGVAAGQLQPEAAGTGHRIEVIVNQEALRQMDVLLDEVLLLSDVLDQEGNPLYLK